MEHIFVSYSRQDTEWVRSLVRRLELRGLPVWLDQRDIPVTLPWVEEVQDAIVAADLFLVCDSPFWRSSENCAIEARMAEEQAKPTCTVTVGHGPDEAARRIQAEVDGLDPAYALRTELAVLARDWDRAFRPGGALVGAKHRRRLARGGAAVDPPLSPVETAFLRASRRRARRRRAATAVVAASIALSSVAWLGANAANDRITTANDAQARGYIEANERAIRAERDHYAALSDAQRLGGNESALFADAVQAALRYPVPDDGFKVPANARRFVAGSVGATVRVTDGPGRTWGRSAAERDLRSATRVPRLEPEPRLTRADGLSARIVPGTGVVEVRRHGVLWRRLVFWRRVRTVEISPDGRELAAAVGDTVGVADLARGRLRTRLRSTHNAVRDVTWSADGRRVWALSQGLVVTWVAHEGVELVDEPESSFNSVLPSTTPSRAWIVSTGGEMREIDLRDGRKLRAIRMRDKLTAAAAAVDGTVAAATGERGLWLVGLDDALAVPRLVRVPPACDRRPAFDGATHVYLTCESGPLLRISVESGAIVERRMLQPGGLFAVRVMPRSHRLLATDIYGWLYNVTDEGLEELVKFTCGGYMTRIAVSPDERILVPAGIGVGMGSCALRGKRGGEDYGGARAGGWMFDHVLEDPDVPAAAEVAAVSRGGGAYAYGFSDGTVVLHPAENLVPRRVVDGIVGRIRDMYVTRDNDLVLATTAGIVHRLDLCETCLSNRAMARVATARLRRGLEIGAARPPG